MAGRKSPWGGDKGGSGEPEPEAEPTGEDAPPPSRGPRNPWVSGGGDGPPRRSAGVEDIFRPRRSGGGGGGGPAFPKLPQRPDGKSWGPTIAGLVVLAWLGLTSTHLLGPKEQGIVTTFGKYSRTIGAGVALTLPWPLQNVSVREVTSIERFNIPDNEGEKLMLTGDQNLVNLSYLVRWNIKDLKLYTFQLENPDETVKQVAEAAMRASIAEVALNDVMGQRRDDIEVAVRERMQGILDAYHSGVQIQGVDIRKADPPANVNEAFQQVTVAQQDAQRDMSRARAYAQQVIARAQGEATEFDKIYVQYKLAPEVTRQRLYYQTMERVLANNDKVVMEGNGVTPYLPLPELRRAAQAAKTGGQ
ncbi:MAG: protease modulator HflK [Novosphingobium sp.]